VTAASDAKITALQKWLALQAVIADLAGKSPSAVVVAAKLLDCHNGKTGQCNPSYGTLARLTGLHKRTVMEAVATLEHASWYTVERTSHKDAKGSGLPSNDFHFNWSRVPSAKNSTTPSENSCTTLVKNSALGGGQNSTTPSEEFCAPPSAVLATQNNERDRNSEIGNCESKRSGDRAPMIGFALWWQNYPRKVGKDAAQKEYNKILASARATEDELLRGAMRYAAERGGEDPQYTKHPRTWLSAGCWADEPSPIGGRPKSRSQPSQRAAMEAILSTADRFRSKP
jgi:hypothetical protein